MDEAISYVDKWLSREPEMQLLPVFAGSAQRRLLPLWGALLHELDAALYELDEASVRQAKLDWWGEELEQAARGAARHPLARALFGELGQASIQVPAASWPALALAALSIASEQDRPTSVAAMLDAQRPYAQAVARVETALFGASDAGDAIAVERVLLALRAGTLRWPLQLLARHQVDEAALQQHPRPAPVRAMCADLAAQLAAALPPTDRGGLFRRVRTALTRRRLRALAQERDARPAGFVLPWLFWRAARAAARASA